MSAREVESKLLLRCAVVARSTGLSASDAQEANVFALAAMLVRSRFPREAEMLALAAERHFERHPQEKLTPGEVVQRGWVFSLPRFHDMLGRQLSQGAPTRSDGTG